MSVAAALKLQRAINARRAERGFGSIITTVAADFLHGGEPGFARIFDRRGRRLTTVQRRENEPWAAFVARAKGEAAKAAQAACTLIGGLPDGSLDSFDNDVCGHDSEPPRNAIVLPETPLHPSQVEALDLIRGNRRVVLVCGRRWGKSSLLVALAVDAALSGQRVGIFAPTRTLVVAIAARHRPRLARREGREHQPHVRRNPFAQWRPCRLLVRSITPNAPGADALITWL